MWGVLDPIDMNCHKMTQRIWKLRDDARFQPWVEMWGVLDTIRPSIMKRLDLKDHDKLSIMI